MGAIPFYHTGKGFSNDKYIAAVLILGLIFAIAILIVSYSEPQLLRDPADYHWSNNFTTKELCLEHLDSLAAETGEYNEGYCE